MDQGNKGYLTFKDIKSGFQAMNYQISDSAIKDMIAVASEDGDDQISFDGKFLWIKIYNLIPPSDKILRCKWDQEILINN